MLMCLSFDSFFHKVNGSLFAINLFYRTYYKERDKSQTAGEILAYLTGVAGDKKVN